MQLIMLLKQEFHLTLGPGDLNRDSFETLSDLSELVTRKLNNQINDGGENDPPRHS
jgi:acyl carrier protein